MILRSALTVLISICVWQLGVFGYHHATEAYMQRQHAAAQAITRAVDIQRMRDSLELRACQTHLTDADLSDSTAIMVAHSALRQCGMAR